MHSTISLLVGALALATTTTAQDIPSYTQTFVNATNGQLRTPGHVIVNAPQPWTPLGGDSLQISLDVTANGSIPLPPYKDDAQDRVDEVSIFLTSNIIGINLTITNPVDLRDRNYSQTELEAYRGGRNKFEQDERIVMWQEPGSNVKHVNWDWPYCLAKGGQAVWGTEMTSSSDHWSYRGHQPVGAYNISIHQLGKIKGKDYYSVFHLPIIVKDDIVLFDSPHVDGGRVYCEHIYNNWVYGIQGENMSLDEYPWKSDKDQVVQVPSEMGKVDEHVKWPKGESEVEWAERLRRYKNIEEAEASLAAAASAATATSTSSAVGARQTAQMVLGAAAAGLGMVL